MRLGSEQSRRGEELARYVTIRYNVQRNVTRPFVTAICNDVRYV
jgi:hypothetical protein